MTLAEVRTLHDPDTSSGYAICYATRVGNILIPLWLILKEYKPTESSFVVIELQGGLIKL